MPLTLVGMARVFLDDIDRGPPAGSQDQEDDIEEIDTVTSTVSEYALSDDGIDEADFAFEKERPIDDDDDNHEEEEPSSTSSLTRCGSSEDVEDESILQEPEHDATGQQDTFNDLRTSLPGDNRYSYLPSILVTEIDDFNVPRSSQSDPRYDGTSILFEPFPPTAKTRTGRMLPQNNHPAVSGKGPMGGSEAALGVSKFSYQQECKCCYSCHVV